MKSGVLLSASAEAEFSADGYVQERSKQEVPLPQMDTQCPIGPHVIQQ
jgi:hypothetical protein